MDTKTFAQKAILVVAKERMSDNRNIQNYDVYNDSYTYDEHYSESSTEFLVSPKKKIVSLGKQPRKLRHNFAQKSILNMTRKKNMREKAVFEDSYAVVYNDDYNDCSYAEVYDQN